MRGNNKMNIHLHECQVPSTLYVINYGKYSA